MNAGEDTIGRARIREPKQRPARRAVARGEEYRALECEVRARLLEGIGHSTIREVADSIGLHRESVRRALRDGIIPLELVFRICSRFGLSADWVIFGRGDPRPPACAATSRDRRGSAIDLCERLLEQLRAAISGSLAPGDDAREAGAGPGSPELGAATENTAGG